MFSVKDYLSHLQLTEQQVTTTYQGLFNLQQRHFYQIPFSNLFMADNFPHQLDKDYLFEQMIIKRRGGICYEFCAVIQPLLSALGFTFRTRLARVYQPTLSAATHQLFVITLDSRDWLLDIGFGARGPRAPLLLEEGYTYEHPFLSSQISKNPQDGWLIYIKEKRRPTAKWELLYSFHDNRILEQDIAMSYFYIAHSPASPFTQHDIASLPTPQGRISFRDTEFTEIIGQQITKMKFTKQERRQILQKLFGMQ